MVTLLVLAQHGLVGPMQTSVDLTYVSDTVLLLRFFEAGGQIRRAISVMKKRTGGHETDDPRIPYRFAAASAWASR